MIESGSIRYNYLTKSLFQKACECPRKLAYYSNPSKFAILEDEKGSFAQNLALDGKKIGAYSRLLYPNGIEVKGTSTDDILDRTKKLIEQLESPEIDKEQSSITIFEGAFCSGPLFARADIVHVVANDSNDKKHLHLMEVKAKSWDSRKGISQLVTNKGSVRADFLPYVRDVAFQKLIIQNAYPNYEVSAYLVLPDKAKINTAIPNLNGLFQVQNDDIILEDEAKEIILNGNEMLVTKVDVNEFVDSILNKPLIIPGSDGETFNDLAWKWGALMGSGDDNILDNELQPPIGSQCRDCEFRSESNNTTTSGFAVCWNKITGLLPENQNNLVVDLYFGGRTIDKLIAARKYQMNNIESEDLKQKRDKAGIKRKDNGISLTERQLYQAQDTKSYVFDSITFEKQMESWEYPFHFIDFETVVPALPYTINKSPFEMTAFQFSHHVLHNDGSVEHKTEFLHAIPGECPNLYFLEALRDCLKDRNGTVFRWGAYEQTVLSALLKSIRNSGKNITDQHLLESILADGDWPMVDLMKVTTDCYYVRGSGGSSSLKRLLLPTMKISQKLKDTYSNPNYNGKNFSNMQWWVENEGELWDPYVLLNKFENEKSFVLDGGGAIVAYNALQNAYLDTETRASLEASLRRYCELDTLAMVMIMQGLQDLLDNEFES